MWGVHLQGPLVLWSEAALLLLPATLAMRALTDRLQLYCGGASGLCCVLLLLCHPDGLPHLDDQLHTITGVLSIRHTAAEPTWGVGVCVNGGGHMRGGGGRC